MRYDLSKPEKVWHAEITRSTAETFKQLFPIDGSRVWALELGLELLVRRLEENPELLSRVKQAVFAMRTEDTPRDLVRINFRISTQLTARFDSLLPETGAPTWFVRSLLDTLVEQLMSMDFSLDKLVEDALSNVLTKETPGVGAD